MVVAREVDFDFRGASPGSYPELPKSDAALSLVCPEDIPGALASAACARCPGLGAVMAGARSPFFSSPRLLSRCRGRSDGAATRHLWLRSRYPSNNKQHALAIPLRDIVRPRQYACLTEAVHRIVGT